jgi:hypothetical protein
MWNDVHFNNCVLLGKLSCIAFGDFFEVASEVIVQCFFNLERDHFDYRRSKRLQVRTAILHVAFIQSLPRRNR